MVKIAEEVVRDIRINSCLGVLLIALGIVELDLWKLFIAMLPLVNAFRAVIKVRSVSKRGLRVCVRWDQLEECILLFHTA